MLSETGYAKLNLALHVRSRRDDGYHILDTIFAFLDDGDRLTAQLDDGLKLTISGPYGGDLSADGDNLVMKAAQAIQQRYNIDRGALIALDKRLPIASGIGGGSADAAAVARLMNKLWDIGASNDELAACMAPLGADIPACIYSVMQKGQGTGTDLERLDNDVLHGQNILLVNPNKPLSTGPVFHGWDGKDRGALAGANLMEIILSGRNDLQASAVRLCPEISDILAVLEKHSPLITRMSGSGATCFSLFESKSACDAAHKAIENDYPGWWAMAGNLR